MWVLSLVMLTIGGIFAYWLGGLGGAIVFLVTLGVAYKVYETWTFSDRFDRFSRRLDPVDTQCQAGIDLPTDGELYRFDINHPDTNGVIE